MLTGMFGKVVLSKLQLLSNLDNLSNMGKKMEKYSAYVQREKMEIEQRYSIMTLSTTEKSKKVNLLCSVLLVCAMLI